MSDSCHLWSDNVSTGYVLTLMLLEYYTFSRQLQSKENDTEIY